jgi:hypothetical protein
MKKSDFISAENMRLILIAIVLAALILLIPFYIKAEDVCRIDNSSKGKKSMNCSISDLIPDKTDYKSHLIN